MTKQKQPRTALLMSSEEERRLLPVTCGEELAETQGPPASEGRPARREPTCLYEAQHRATLESSRYSLKQNRVSSLPL